MKAKKLMLKLLKKREREIQEELWLIDKLIKCETEADR